VVAGIAFVGVGVDGVLVVGVEVGVVAAGVALWVWLAGADVVVAVWVCVVGMAGVGAVVG
jgi:hypothetical protein